MVEGLAGQLKQVTNKKLLLRGWQWGTKSWR